MAIEHESLMEETQDGPGRTRTSDQLIMSQPLCQLSYGPPVRQEDIWAGGSCQDTFNERTAKG